MSLQIFTKDFHTDTTFIVLELVTLMHLTRYSVKTVETCGYLDAHRAIMRRCETQR